MSCLVDCHNDDANGTDDDANGDDANDEEDDDDDVDDADDADCATCAPDIKLPLPKAEHSA